MPRALKAPEIPARVRSRLRDLVAADGRTATEVASAADMSQQQLSQVLSGIKVNPSVETVGRVLAVLGRTWRDLD